MRLLRLDIAGFRSIRYQALAAEGLVVLFGPNSSGKTSVLEAAEQLIARSAIRRTDPAEVWELYAEGSVTFDLPAADADGSSDAEVYRWLLCGDHSDERAWDWLGGYTSERIRGAGLGDAREQLAARLAQSGVAGSRADRELLARSLFDPGAAFFLAGDGGVLLHARSASLTTETLAAATRIAETAMDVDPLSAMAEHLVAEGSARVGDLADSAEVRERLAAAFPPVIVLDGDADSLAAEIENVIPRIHDRLWNLRLPKTPLPGLTGAYGQRHDPFEMAYDTTSSTSLSADLWLEGMSASGEAVIGGVFGPYDTGEWSRVRHSVLAVARMIEDEANRVAPSFVRSQGTIGIELIPVAAWRAGQHRVRATFTEPGADRRDLRVVGAGTARWAAASIRLACRRLAEARQVVTGAGATALANADGIQEEVRRARTSPLTQTAVRLEPSDAPGFYIADEPEQHLHPAAIRSVRDWLTQLAQTAATVLAATHSPILLDNTSELVQRVLVLRGQDGTKLRSITGSLDAALADSSGELGLTQGDLLLMTRMALFVEGPHDQIILTEWFGDELSGAGIRVFPLHGVDNLMALFESDIVTALGIGIAALTDDTSMQAVNAGRPKTRGERAISRLLQEAQAVGVQVKAVGLSRPDILWYLDDEVCRQFAPRFPGWAAARAARAAAGVTGDWKRWVTSHYGLPLGRKDIRGMAAACRIQGKLPTELAQRIRELAAHAK